MLAIKFLKIQIKTQGLIIFLFSVPGMISHGLVLDINTLIIFSYAWGHIEPFTVNATVTLT